MGTYYDACAASSETYVHVQSATIICIKNKIMLIVLTSDTMLYLPLPLFFQTHSRVLQAARIQVVGDRRGGHVLVQNI